MSFGTFSSPIYQVSRLVGDRRKGPAWGPLNFQKDHLTSNESLNIKQSCPPVSRLVGDIRKGPAWGPLSLQGDHLTSNELLHINPISR